MNFNSVLHQSCGGIGLVRRSGQTYPTPHRDEGHAPPISGSSGCGCIYDACPGPHITTETPLVNADATKAAIVSYLDPVRVARRGWRIESREPPTSESD